MDTFITIATFSYPSELTVVKSKLESEGITCFVKDELTVQTYGLYSNAIGGIKLQVLQQDAEKALTLLKAWGHFEEASASPSKLWALVDQWSQALPQTVSKWSKAKFIIPAVVVIISMAGAIHWLNLPNTYESLTKHAWCVDKLEYQGKEYSPATSGFRLILSGDCYEPIEFKRKEVIVFPGFNTRAILGNWTLEGDTLYVSRADTFEHIFKRNYMVNIKGNNLVLTSDKTTIYCHLRGTYE